jgi:uncharacterized RDD family membrane protein YckC
MAQDSPTVEPLRGEVPLEGKPFLPRAAAYAIDMVVWGLLDYVFASVSAFFLFLPVIFVGAVLGFEFTVEDTEPSLLDYVARAALLVIYFAIFEALYGASPAKLLLRMRVVGPDGRPPSLRRAFIRSLWRFIDGLFLGVVAAYAMEPPERQRHGDRQANTLVVEASSPLISMRPSLAWFAIALLLYAAISSVLQLLATLPDLGFVRIG